MLKSGQANKSKVWRLSNAKWGIMLLRAVAILLVALFAAAALHELVLVALGLEHAHDHETCPFCVLIHTPILAGFCTILILRFFSRRTPPLPAYSAPATRRFALQPDLRAPPSL